MVNGRAAVRKRASSFLTYFCYLITVFATLSPSMKTVHLALVTNLNLSWWLTPCLPEHGTLFPFSEISYNATVQSQRTMSFYMHVNRYMNMFSLCPSRLKARAAVKIA